MSVVIDPVDKAVREAVESLSYRYSNNTEDDKLNRKIIDLSSQIVAETLKRLNPGLW